MLYDARKTKRTISDLINFIENQRIEYWETVATGQASAVWRKAPLNWTIFRFNLEKMTSLMISMLTSSTIDGCDFYNPMQLFGNS